MTQQIDFALPQRFLRMCRRNMRHPKVADSQGTELTGAGLLMRTLILRRLLLRHTLQTDEPYVGVLLPPSVAAVITNAALTLDHRTAVNLNYTVPREAVHEAITQCCIRNVVTSRRLVERLPFKPDANLVFLEDLQRQATWLDKLMGAIATWLAPTSLLNRWFGLGKIQRDDLVTVLFTSGTTGKPKGVMLTYGNISSNVDAILQVLSMRNDDVVAGILPFFQTPGRSEL